MKYYNKTYQNWVRFLNNKVTKNLCHQTKVSLEHNGDITIKYWYTTLVTINFQTQNLELNTGRFYTVTTKKRLNQLTPYGFFIYQKDFTWYAEDVTGKTKIFEDNMKIDKYGNFI